MDSLRIISDNCIKLNKTTMTMKFSDHVNNESIVVLPASVFPFVRYKYEQYYNDSTLWFTICGPMILLMTELARLRQSW